MEFEEISTFSDADRYLAETMAPGPADASDDDTVLACLLADALRSRGKISPQEYAAIYDNPDYVRDRTLHNCMDLTWAEDRFLRRWSR